MKNLRTYKEFINEGIFDLFKRRKKEVKGKKNKYNPNNIGYDHPDFAKEFIGFSKDPEKEIDETLKSAEAAKKKLKPLVAEIEVDFQHIREMMTQQDMVNGDDANKYYIGQIDTFLNELETFDIKIRKGIW